MAETKTSPDKCVLCGNWIFEGEQIYDYNDGRIVVKAHKGCTPESITKEHRPATAPPMNPEAKQLFDAVLFLAHGAGQVFPPLKGCDHSLKEKEYEFAADLNKLVTTYPTSPPLVLGIFGTLIQGFMQKTASKEEAKRTTQKQQLTEWLGEGFTQETASKEEAEQAPQRSTERTEMDAIIADIDKMEAERAAIAEIHEDARALTDAFKVTSDKP